MNDDQVHDLEIMLKAYRDASEDPAMKNVKEGEFSRGVQFVCKNVLEFIERTKPVPEPEEEEE